MSQRTENYSIWRDNDYLIQDKIIGKSERIIIALFKRQYSACEEDIYNRYVKNHLQSDSFCEWVYMCATSCQKKS